MNNNAVNRFDLDGRIFEWIPLLGSVESLIKTFFAKYPGMKSADYEACLRSASSDECKLCIANKQFWYTVKIVAPNAVKLGIDYGITIISTYLGVVPVAVGGAIVSAVDTLVTLTVIPWANDKVKAAAEEAASGCWVCDVAM